VGFAYYIKKSYKTALSYFVEALVRYDEIGILNESVIEHCKETKKRLTTAEFNVIVYEGLSDLAADRSQRILQYISSPQQTMRREQQKVGRNEPCPCGSGKKYKKCCGVNV